LVFEKEIEILNKLELIQALKEKANLSRQEAYEVVDLFFSEMVTAFIKGERVEIRGFCSFFTKNYKPYIGRNPKTGEKVQIHPKRLPFFRCGKVLRERVDNTSNKK
jgi:integration host factor subunit beta